MVYAVAIQPDFYFFSQIFNYFIMNRIEVPDDLKPFIEDGYGDSTPFSKEIHRLYHSLIEEYFRKDISPEGLKSKPRLFNSNNVHYEDLATAINNWCEKPKFIHQNFLSTLCFPGKEGNQNWTKGRDKEKLIIIYQFLDDFHTSNKRRNGQYWIDHVIRGAEILPEEEIIQHTEYRLNKEVRTNVQGGKIIDSTFKNNLISKVGTYSAKDFYLAKHKDECQWYGIVNDWDLSRANHHTIKATIVVSFQSILNCKISAVICGAGGCGKSTALRRIAIDCIGLDFLVLWLTDVKSFYENIEIFKREIAHKCLIIIEDWEKLKADEITNKLFLNEIRQLDNIRIIIGDRNTVNKEYLNDFDEDNRFILSSSENEKILDKILKVNPAWKNTADKVLSSPEFYKSPLYLILFVVARVNEKIGKDKYFTNVGISAQFQEIVRNDLEEIYKVYPGLSTALYYCACLHNQYGEIATITWEALLKLADSCNKGDNEIFKRFSLLSTNDPIGGILSYYISLEKFIHPGFQNNHLFNFHHELLAQQGISKLFDDTLYFDDKVKLQLLATLLFNNELNSAATLFRIFSEDDTIFKSEKIKREYYMGVYGIDSVAEIRIIDQILIDIYENAKYKGSEKYWKGVLKQLALFEFANIFSDVDLKTILEKILINGCTSKRIKDANKASLISPIRLTQKLLPLILDRIPQELVEYIRRDEKNNIQILHALSRSQSINHVMFVFFKDGLEDDGKPPQVFFDNLQIP